MKKFAPVILALAFAIPNFQAYAQDPLSEYAMMHEKMMKASPAEKKAMRRDMMKSMQTAMKNMDSMKGNSDPAMMSKRMDMLQMMMMDMVQLLSYPGA